MFTIRLDYNFREAQDRGFWDRRLLHDTAVFTIENTAPHYDEKKGITPPVLKSGTHEGTRLTGRWRIDKRGYFHTEQCRHPGGSKLDALMYGDQTTLSIELEYEETYTDHNDKEEKVTETYEEPHLFDGFFARLFGSKPKLVTATELVPKQKTRTVRVWAEETDIQYEHEHTYINDCNAERD